MLNICISYIKIEKMSLKFYYNKLNSDNTISCHILYFGQLFAMNFYIFKIKLCNRYVHCSNTNLK